MGKFITFEGGEGSGKTTHLETIADYLRKDGYSVCTTHDPGGADISKGIRPFILDKKYAVSREAELLLYLAARAELVNKVIIPELAVKDFVLCDRFYDSTAVYQGVIRGWDEIRAWKEEAPRSESSFLEIMHIIFCHNIKPDYTFLFDVDPVTGLERSKGIEIGEGRWEMEGVEVHRIINNAFLDLADMEEDRIIVVNANQELVDVFDEALNLFYSEVI